MAYEKLSLIDAVNYIEQGKMFLPEIQRKFVWREEQIENLFDSIFLGYPIGSLLFWKTTKKTLNNKDLALNIYDFIKEYHQKNGVDNKKTSLPITTDYDSYYIVLDGQQRLTSIYIAIKGSYARKLPHRLWRKDDSFPIKELYMNLSVESTKKILDDDNTKRFKFLTDDEYKKESNKWIKVKDIMRYNESDDFSKDFSDDIARENVSRLYKILTTREDDTPLNYYEIDIDDYDDVLNIFVRLNSSGTPLSKMDLIFSTIVSNWKNGREEIDSLINSINVRDGRRIYNFDINFVMRTSLALTDEPVNLKINSFKKSNVDKIKNNWENIRESLKSTIEFLEKCGFSNDSIMSYNALIPIAYYLYKGGSLSEENINGFRKYFIIAQIKNIFGVASNNAITRTVEAVQKIKDYKKERFSIDLFNDVKLNGGVTDFAINDDVIEKCFEYDKGAYTFMLLTLLYPEIKLDSTHEFHQDHVHPYAGFEKKNIRGKGFSNETIAKWQQMRNKLPNLQLLQGPINQSKSDTLLVEWIEKGNKVKYMPDDITAELKYFDAFFENRKQLMKKELKKVLGYKDPVDGELEAEAE